MQKTKLIDLITNYPNFPKKGILFRDISPLLENPEVFVETINNLSGAVKDIRFNKIVGIDARGFIFAAALAYKLKKGLIICRKPGKLPGKLTTKKYTYEYASTALSMQKERFIASDRILIVDDVLASGNTALTAYKIAQSHARVVGTVFIIELTALGGRKNLLKNSQLQDIHIRNLITF